MVQFVHTDAEELGMSKDYPNVPLSKVKKSTSPRLNSANGQIELQLLDPNCPKPLLAICVPVERIKIS